MSKTTQLSEILQKLRSRLHLSYRGLVGVCLLAVITLLLCAFGAYSYYEYARSCETSAAGEARSSSSKLVSQVDERLQNLRNYYTNVVTWDDVETLITRNIDYSDYPVIKNAQDAFSSQSYLSEYVSGYTFVNYKTDWILSNKGMFHIGEATNPEQLEQYYQDTDEKRLAYYWVYDTSDPITNRVTREYRTTIETDGLCFVMRLPNTYRPNAMLIVKINMDTWKSWISQCLTDGEQVIVTDGNGLVIYSSSDALTALAGTGEENLDAETVTLDGEDYRIALTQSSVLDWHYYVCHSVAAERNGFSFPTVWLVFLLLMAVTLLSVSFYFIYRPIRMLLRDVAPEQSGEEGERRNELELLAGSFRSLRGDNEQLQSMIGQSRDQLLEIFQLRLMRGEVRGEEWNEYIRDFGLRGWNFFATVVLVLDLSDEEIEENLKEDLICLKLVQEFPEEIRSLAWMPPFYNAYTICAILAENDEDTLLNTIRRYCAQADTFAYGVSGYHLIMGVSSNHIDHKHIQAAYRESIKALSYHGFDGAKPETAAGVQESGELSSCHFYLASTTMHASDDYDNSFEKEVQAGIRALDKAQCYEATDRFFTRIRESGDSLYENMIYTVRYVNAILFTAMEARINLDEIYPQGIRKLYSELLDSFEPSRTRRFVKMHFIDPVLEARSALLDRKSYSMLEEIERMIAESKGDITLTQCAEALNVHPTYIWKVLKMDRGRSFSDYVEEYKLEEAKNLLLNSPLSVAEIAAQLGYTNAQNFIRFFSRSMGVTPGKFRRLNG